MLKRENPGACGATGAFGCVCCSADRPKHTTARISLQGPLWPPQHPCMGRSEAMSAAGISATGLAPEFIDRLAKLCGMLGSAHDGERASAGGAG